MATTALAVAGFASLGGLARIQAATGTQRAHRTGGGFTHPTPIDYQDHAGWVRLFNGKDLDGWKGNREVWHVENGAIVGTSSRQHPSGTTNIYYTGREPANFMLEVQFKLEGAGANGGVQYRSQTAPPAGGRWAMTGYQADMDYANCYTGQLYEQGTGRGIIAWPGQAVITAAGKKPLLLGTVGTADEIKAAVKAGEWNQYLIIADGFTMIHVINGRVTAVLVDQDAGRLATKGRIGFEIEGPGTVKISYRDIWLKELDARARRGERDAR
ncbi:MAG: 3-keto-disaccharide hydrolase [Terriglobales bacterium]